MSQFPPNKIISQDNKNCIEINPHILRRGTAENSTNTTIFLGSYSQRGATIEPWIDSQQVAIKRVKLPETKENQRELDALRQFNHPNIIKLHHYEDDGQFR